MFKGVRKVVANVVRSFLLQQQFRQRRVYFPGITILINLCISHGLRLLQFTVLRIVFYFGRLQIILLVTYLKSAKFAPIFK